jgi:hypothetical protein
MVPILNQEQLLVVLKSIFNIKTMKRYNSIFILFFAASILSGCKKDFLDREPISDLTEGNFFKTGNDAESAIIAAYDNLQTEYYIFDYYINNDVVSDDCYAGGDNQNNFQLDRFTTTTTNGNVNRDWIYLYDAISRTNAVLDNVGNINSPDLTETRKQEILGEAAFLRAMHYFQLVNLYGAIPLITHKVNSTDPSIVYQARVPVEAIYESIITDLNFAVSRVPWVYPSSKQRATRGACYALLAKAHAHKPTPNWAEVLNATSAITSGSTYSLMTNYNFLWDGNHENCAESIFEIQFVASGSEANWGPQLTLPPSITKDSWRKFNTPSNDLIAAFKAAGDTLRYHASIVYETKLPWKDSYFPNDTIPFTYKLRTAAGWASPNNNILIRLADVILLQAEAKTELNDLAGAITDLNTIRTRAMLPNTHAVSQDQLRDSIALERRLELAFEGHRWFDLKRTGKAISTMNNLNLDYNVTTERLIWPIPQNELDRNPKLTQNPGY